MKQFFALCLFFLLLFSSCSQKDEHYLIGVSQCSEDEWRTQMNKEIIREALFYPQAEVEIKTAKDDNRKQIEDIKQFIGYRGSVRCRNPGSIGRPENSFFKIHGVCRSRQL